MVHDGAKPPLIAVDMDDVLCRTNEAVAEWHNAQYGTNMTISDFHYYHYWKASLVLNMDSTAHNRLSEQNPGWGTPTETLHKVRIFSESDEFLRIPPVKGAIEGAKALKALGYRLEIVTARSNRHRPMTNAWLAKWLPGIIDQAHYTGEFEHNPNAAVPPPTANGVDVVKKITKADILVMIGARALIDDSLPNALICASVAPVLLFGDYQWNKRPSTDSRAQDRMSYVERERWEEIEAKYRASQNGTEITEDDWHKWWEREDLHQLPAGIARVNSWEGVIDWVKSSEGQKALHR